MRTSTEVTKGTRRTKTEVSGGPYLEDDPDARIARGGHDLRCKHTSSTSERKRNGTGRHVSFISSTNIHKSQSSNHPSLPLQKYPFTPNPIVIIATAIIIITIIMITVIIIVVVIIIIITVVINISIVDTLNITVGPLLCLPSHPPWRCWTAG